MCAHLLGLCNVLTDVSSCVCYSMIHEPFHLETLPWCHRLNYHRLPSSRKQVLSRRRTNGIPGLDDKFWPLRVGLLCLPLETELVNIPPNKGTLQANGQNLVILSVLYKVWWSSRTNVIFIRTSQLWVVASHPPCVQTISISSPLVPFFWHRKSGLQRTPHGRRFPGHLVLLSRIGLAFCVQTLI